MASTEKWKHHIKMEKDHVMNTYGTDYGDDATNERFNVKSYCKQFSINIISMSEDSCEMDFDLTNIDAPHANALRRILIAEVPSIAIEKIFLYQNTSVIQDEVLAHRLGLIPIKADYRLFKDCSPGVYKPADHRGAPEEPSPNPEESLIFELKVKCTKRSNAPKESGDLNDMYDHLNVYSKDMKWIPIGDQEKRFQGKGVPRPIVPDILIAKLRPGNEIELRAHAIKGIGRDHAKYSPVATASYRLLPVINLKEEISGEAAERLKESFSEGVIGIKEVNGKQVAEVLDARKDMCSRNIYRHEDLAPKVEMTRDKRHFIFSVESTGAVSSPELVIEACKTMQDKVTSLRDYFRENIQKKLGPTD